ncbi:Glu-tRNA(Gln) amidotransferase subunit GatE [Mesoterricola silvestris]|uniref:Glutamyl-tRNA(Gln) amidotransferase subunit E n=1 Tax=Mesoterricola silvestris TaxID=2927979 RepID=A0AA48GN21_9BACT|nr:Glu-tRNA(Gln) amidotransferase subunit GatE [Mesoterricola silvestris]BDU74427.1 glutamyl-tRNA(Gln) amidotransferase subunit E [Mesoterricola silvestris]
MIEKLDYQSAGLISGLEVHQQLLTAHKLFCRCPAGLYTHTHDGEVLRHMRPTLSELGEYDGTALMEFKTRKEIIYLLNHLNVCTYEMDDTPPFLVNQEAIDVAIELCLAMGMDIIDEVHIARKQYLDGSIPTGFQRTAIVGMNGGLPFKGRRLSVTHLSIEEDSCREVSDKGHRIVWRTDRLGMPLTETVTGPDLRTPEEVRDAITLCGLVARSTGRVRTGLGASRQDVNVSVAGGSRVEIKGVPKAGYAVKLVHNEGVRQVNLLRFREELHRRGMREPADIRTSAVDVSEIFQGVDLGFMQRALRGGGRIFAVKLEGGLGLAQFPTQPDTTFLDELSGRIRVIACLDEAPIVLSGLHMPEFPARHRVLDRVRRKLRLGENDDYFIVFGPEADCRTAAEEIRLRFVDALKGVPQETRQAMVGGFTTFERILPGPDRMYPDTDSPPTRITPERVEAARARMKPTPWERFHQFGAWRVPAETTEFLIRRGGVAIVDAVVQHTGVDGLVAAVEIGQRAKALQRRGIPMERLGASEWVQIFDLLTGGQISREAIPALATHMATHPGSDAVAAMSALGFGLQPREAWSRQLAGLSMEDYRIDLGDSDGKRLRFLAGRAMKDLLGKAPARDVADYLRNRLTQEAAR